MALRFLKDQLNINFMKRRVQAGFISAALIFLSFVAYFVMGGLNFGIDFRGGTLVQVQFDRAYDIADLRATLLDADLGSFALQSFGDESTHEYLVTLSQDDSENGATDENSARKVESALHIKYPSAEVRRVESVGPQVGEELKLSALYAVLLSIGAILLYVWLRFQWRFSVGAVVALLHDVLIVVAAFVLTQKEITLPVVAAILTVAGYSINDTIVIFDRIRENMRRYQRKDLLELINESISQTISRTLLTSGTTLFVVLSIFIFGGGIIHDFAFALLVGIVVGTYSSIYIATPVVYFLRQLFPPKLH